VFGVEPVDVDPLPFPPPLPCPHHLHFPASYCFTPVSPIPFPALCVSLKWPTIIHLLSVIKHRVELVKVGWDQIQSVPRFSKVGGSPMGCLLL